MLIDDILNLWGRLDIWVAVSNNTIIQLTIECWSIGTYDVE